MGYMNKWQAVEGVKQMGYIVEDTMSDELCEGCIYGKMMQHSFGIQVKKVTKSGECIYSDLWELGQVDSLGGKALLC